MTWTAIGWIACAILTAAAIGTLAAFAVAWGATRSRTSIHTQPPAGRPYTDPADCDHPAETDITPLDWPTLVSMCQQCGSVRTQPRETTSG